MGSGSSSNRGWYRDEPSQGRNNTEGLGCCGSDLAEKNDNENKSVILEDSKRVEMRRNNESVSQILHYPDDFQQVTVLQQMQEQLREELEQGGADPSAQGQNFQLQPLGQPLGQTGSQPTQPSLVSPQGRSPSALSSQQRPLSNTAAIIQRQLNLYEQLIKLVQNHQNELHKLRGTSGNKVGQTTTAFAPTTTAFAPTTTAFAPTTTSFPPGNSSSPPSAVNVPTQRTGTFEPQNALLDEHCMDALLGSGPRQEAYHSGLREDDSNALARLLKKHFNNFVLECEFNASGNIKAFEILRSRRCDRLDVDSAYSSGHNLTIERTRHIADLFLKYSMTVIDAQKWGGELRYAVKRQNVLENSGAIAVNGSISYLTSDRTMKFDAPYQVEIGFILQKG